MGSDQAVESVWECRSEWFQNPRDRAKRAERAAAKGVEGGGVGDGDSGGGAPARTPWRRYGG